MDVNKDIKRVLVTFLAGVSICAVGAATYTPPKVAPVQSGVQSTQGVGSPGAAVGGVNSVQGVAGGVPVPVSGSFTPSGLQNVNLTQVGSSAVALGQTTMSASIPVTLASNQSALNVNVNGADTTTAISFTGNSQNAAVVLSGYYGCGVTLTGTWSATVSCQLSNDGGTTWTASNFVNIATGTLSATETTNGNYAIQVAGGTSNVRVLTTAYVSGTVTGNIRATIAQLNGFDTIVAGAGVGIPGNAVPATAIYNGTQAITTLPTAATPGNIVGTSSDKFGRVITIPQSPRDNVLSQPTIITSSTAATTVVTAGASGVYDDICSIVIGNSSATQTLVTLSDGTKSYYFIVAPGLSPGISLQVPYAETTAATAWTATCGTSVASIYVTVQYIQNK